MKGLLKTWHFLICGKNYSQAPWPTRPKIGVCVLLKYVAVILWIFFFEPPPSYGVEKRRDHRNARWIAPWAEVCWSMWRAHGGFQWSALHRPTQSERERINISLLHKRPDCPECGSISVIPPLLNTITQQRGGGGGGCSRYKKNLKITVSQLRALATHTPILGRIGQGAWS